MSAKADFKKIMESPDPKRRKTSSHPLLAAGTAPKEAAGTERYLPSALWSQVFLFTNLKDIPEIACVSKEWNAALKVVGEQDELWESLFAAQCPRLAKIVKDYYLSDPSATKQWKDMLKTRIVSPFKPDPLNKDFQKDLETVCSPMGILAFSNCCTCCTSSYLEGGMAFPSR